MQITSYGPPYEKNISYVPTLHYLNNLAYLHLLPTLFVENY